MSAVPPHWAHGPTHSIKQSVPDGLKKGSGTTGPVGSRVFAPAGETATTQSDRSITDGDAPMGVGATCLLERVAGALGQLDQAQPSSEPADDISNGGVLCVDAERTAFTARRLHSAENIPEATFRHVQKKEPPSTPCKLVNANSTD